MGESLRRRARFIPGTGFYVWLALMAIAVVMTQALRSPVSHMLFWFVAILLPISVVYLLIGFFAIQVYVSANQTQTEKEKPLEYEVSIINSSPLCFPTLETVISVPRQDGVRCGAQRLILFLMPLGSYEIRHETTFRFRGTYEIGMDCLYISDLFRMFRLRRDIDLYHTVLVYPRKLPLDDRTTLSVSEVPSSSTHRLRGDDPGEIGNLREYRPGDGLKSVHWKLSSKAQDLLIKEYETDLHRRVYVLCDFAARKEEGTPVLIEEPPRKKKKKQRRVKIHREGEARETLFSAALASIRLKRRKKWLGEETKTSRAAEGQRMSSVRLRAAYEGEINERNADGVAEITVSVILDELRRGNICTLLWYDARAEEPIRSFEIASGADLEAIWPSFTTTPWCAPENDISRLTVGITDSLNVTVRVVSAALDPVTLTAMESIPAMLGGACAGSVTEFFLFDPSFCYEPAEARQEEIIRAGERLMQNGVRMKIVKEMVHADGQVSFASEI